jgi:hypothetical protein
MDKYVMLAQFVKIRDKQDNSFRIGKQMLNNRGANNIQMSAKKLEEEGYIILKHCIVNDAFIDISGIVTEKGLKKQLNVKF